MALSPLTPASRSAFPRLSSDQRPMSQGDRGRRVRLKPTFIRRPRRMLAANAPAA